MLSQWFKGIKSAEDEGKVSGDYWSESQEGCLFCGRRPWVGNLLTLIHGRRAAYE